MPRPRHAVERGTAVEPLLELALDLRQVLRTPLPNVGEEARLLAQPGEFQQQLLDAEESGTQEAPHTGEGVAAR